MSAGTTAAAQPAAAPAVAFGTAVGVWLQIGLTSFGGPAGQIALMHRVLVEEKRWIGEARFLHALNYCMLLPGPEAMQLATYVGWLLHGTRGGLVAGTLFILPGFLVIMALSALYAGFQDLSLVQAIFFGIKAAVLAVVFDAVLRIARRALGNALLTALAAVSFIGIFFFDVPFPVIVIAAGVFGFFGQSRAPALFVGKGAHGPAQAGAEDTGPEPSLRTVPATAARALGVLGVWLPLWFGPILLLVLTVGSSDIYARLAVFFSKMAVVTFGGAYAVLAYVAQAAVEDFGWLRPGEMLDGLGLAETTPGPLILVLQYVGFLASFRDPGSLDPFLAGAIGGALVVWVTFVPCFLWIFLGAPYVERLRENQRLSAALTAITAAVVGVILNLAAWFALHVLFRTVDTVRIGPLKLEVPALASLDTAALVLAALAVLALFRVKVGMLPTLAGCAALGALYRLVLVPLLGA
ncbi:MAG: chromate efflux transporter [Alphaproteobacteria bacterium]|nr:chromate efflux transporter [Alphaproteobacteria bacterium]